MLECKASLWEEFVLLHHTLGFSNSTISAITRSPLEMLEDLPYPEMI